MGLRSKNDYVGKVEKILEGDYHRPLHCPACGAELMYKGTGEYECRNCHSLEYDDYGKVRLYIESHPGAKIMDVANMTGVDIHLVRKMLREGMLAK